MTTNKPMTSEQLDELMTVAVNMQRDSEKVGERSVAMFAYAVQVAVLELRKVREIKPADEDHVAAMNSITAIIAILGLSDTLGISEQVAELKAQRDALAAENARLIKFITQECHVAHIEPETFYEEEITRYVSADGYQPETPASDALLAEVRAQVWMEAKDLAKSAIASDSIDHIDFLFDGKAAQLRKGAAQ
ncbi:hypothetical protein [Enterobacter soli]|uniref:Prophage protein n=1 Tax=Enterobacter soli TaxID=885040 RepID=A0AAW8H2Z4_9ENTR|nr:hypothetical protein [Enterobacter soli]MDQ2255140.1 hypothetical protein [Enterobacter soli]MDQ2337059.1 hypothetical protein [Enterobacter soli]HEE9789230.1 hypothetical protein [Enterobacter soli]